MKRLLIHFIVWAILFNFFFVAFTIFMPVREALIRTVPALALMIVVFYFIGGFVTEQLLIKKKRPFIFALVTISIVTLFAFIRARYMSEFPIGKDDQLFKLFQEGMVSETDADLKMARRVHPGYALLLVSFILYAVIALFAVLLRMYTYKNEKELESREQLQKSQEAQIAYLKAQVNPHFLFNTLNNLYGLTYSKSDKAPQIVLGLSESMRYLIYETNQKLVTVAKELSFVRNYIELERTRLVKPDQIHCSVQVSYESMFIPPLLLIPFIENCFKHGSVGRVETGWVEIDIWNKGQTLSLVCKNNYSSQSKENKNSGFGLKNVKKRLDLLYGDNYKLEIKQDEDEYLVSLNLPLFNRKDAL